MVDITIIIRILSLEKKITDPFILRGITLVGVDSVYYPIKDRYKAWQRLADDLNLEHLENMTKLLSLTDTIKAAEDMLNNKSYGRIVVDVNA